MRLYVSLARRLLETKGPSAPWDVTHPLGFPSFLAFMLSDGGTLLQAGYAQMVVGCLVPGAVGLLGLAAFGPRTGMLAVVFASLYFPFVEYGALFLSEIHFTLWMALAFAGFLGRDRGAPAQRVASALAAAGGARRSPFAIALKYGRRCRAALAFFAADGVGAAARASAIAVPPPLPPPLRRARASALGAARRRWPRVGRGAAAGSCWRGSARAPTAATSACRGTRPAADFLAGPLRPASRDLAWAAGRRARVTGFGSPGSRRSGTDEHARAGSGGR